VPRIITRDLAVVAALQSESMFAKDCAKDCAKDYAQTGDVARLDGCQGLCQGLCQESLPEI